MSDLYRITVRCDTPGCSRQHVHDRNGYRRHWEKVEPCEHGNYDLHPSTYASVRAREGDLLEATTGWCDGAGLS